MSTPHVIEDLSAASLAAFDAVIDVRSPSEFAEDHLPGAVNLPVLDDAERALVGETYVQHSPFLARRMGAALVARNSARHLETALGDCDRAWRPLVYCWRGGMRSGAFAHILSSVGWRTSVVRDGYRRWRREVVSNLTHDRPFFEVILIDGQTGAGKTDVIRALMEAGAQAIDLEGLAAHRGSAFGGVAQAPQPAQKLFESRLWTILRTFDPRRPVFVEAESSLIGRLRTPRNLWSAMKAAVRIEVSAPAPLRIERILSDYLDVSGSIFAVEEAIERLRPFHPRPVVDGWRALAASGDFRTLASELVERHYDPGYESARRRQGGGTYAATFTVEGVDADAARAVARAVLSWCDAARPRLARS